MIIIIIIIKTGTMSSINQPIREGKNQEGGGEKNKTNKNLTSILIVFFCPAFFLFK